MKEGDELIITDTTQPNRFKVRRIQITTCQQLAGIGYKENRREQQQSDHVLLYFCTFVINATEISQLANCYLPASVSLQLNHDNPLCKIPHAQWFYLHLQIA